MSTRDLRLSGVSRRRAAGPEFVKLRRGLVGFAGVEASHPDLRIAAVAEQLAVHSVIGGWAAARLLEQTRATDDLTVFDGTDWWEERHPRDRDPHGARVLVCAPRGSRLRHRPDVRIFRSEVTAEERSTLSGIPVTSPLRTAFDLARLLPVAPAVVALDRLANIGAVGLGDLSGLVRDRMLVRGRQAALRALSLADGGAESPQETLLRLAWIRAGYPRPLCNPVILDEAGAFVARVDLLDPATGVVGEYDGAVHSGARARSRDAARQELLVDLGLTIVRATGHDVWHDGVSRTWEQRLRSAYRRAGRTAASERRWVVRGRR